jgi:hypothetical protein
MRKTWRCFFCDVVFRREEDARLHFGVVAYSEPACQIKGHEGGLVAFIRQQERELAKYRAETDPLTRVIEELRSEHAAALKLEEEKGYIAAVRDMQGLALKQFGRKVDV